MSSTDRLVETLLQAAGRSSGQVDFARFSGLPPPVKRYLEHVLRDGQPLIRVARLEQEGHLGTAGSSTRWMPFQAEQVVVPVGFVWDAKVSVLPLLHVRVRDAYVGGVGSGQVRLMSAITVATESGRPELNSGALHRYLAEAAWYPTALVPSRALQWSKIDRSQALATLTDSGTSVSLQFRFNDEGEVSGIYSPGRWGKFGSEYRQAPWEGHFRNYQERDGMLVPTEADVGWYREKEWEKVWEGRITTAKYE